MAATTAAASKSRGAAGAGWAVGAGSAEGGTGKAWEGMVGEIGGRPGDSEYA